MSRDRYPRTLTEAFGPYTSSHFEPDPPHCFFRAIGALLLRMIGVRR
jgi:hypothetical protein